MSRLTRDGTAEPVSRDQILRHARVQGNIIFHVQLTTSRIGSLTRLIHTLLYVMTIHSARTRAISLFKTSSRISSGVRAADRCEFSSFDCLLCSVGRLLPPPPPPASPQVGCCCCCCFLTLTDPLRIQPWSQDRRNQTKSNRESEMSMESRQKRTDKK